MSTVLTLVVVAGAIYLYKYRKEQVITSVQALVAWIKRPN